MMQPAKHDSTEHRGLGSSSIWGANNKGASKEVKARHKCSFGETSSHGQATHGAKMDYTTCSPILSQY